MNVPFQYRGPLPAMQFIEQCRRRGNAQSHHHVSLLAMALQYAKLGWPVLPCEPRSKKPLTSHGFKDATLNPVSIQSFWNKWPDANIGIATGISSGVLVVDVDPRNGGDTQLAELEARYGHLPRDYTINSGGGGFHIYLQLPTLPVQGWSCCKLAPGIDIKGDGGYIIAPPSLHPSGQRYQFRYRCAELPPVPDWLTTLLHAKNGAQAHASGRANTQTDDLRASDEIKQVIREGKPTGQRSEAIFAALRALICAGHTDDEIIGVFMDSANGISEKPLEMGFVWLQGEIKRAREKPGLSVSSAAQSRSDAVNSRGQSVKDGSLHNQSNPVSYRRLSDIKAKPIDWLWRGRIARGKVSMIAGNPGLGKSQLTLFMAAVVSTGGEWPVDGSSCERGSVLLLSAEDDPADTLRPRLEAAGADLDRCYVLDAVRDHAKSGAELLRPFNLKADLARLEKLLIELGDVKLIVIDPVTSYLGGADSHNNAEIRTLLAPLGELAARYEVAVVCVTHLNKGGINTEALMRVTGSIGFVAVARAAFVVVKDREDDARRLFLPLKNNIGNDLNGLAFALQSHVLPGEIETSRVVWENEAVSMSADDAMAGDVNEQRSGTGKAVEWLREVLVDGPMAASEVERCARDHGISTKMLRRARESLGIKPQKQGFEGGWWWSIPDDEDAPKMRM